MRLSVHLSRAAETETAEVEIECDDEIAASAEIEEWLGPLTAEVRNITERWFAG